jgi:Icc-related predicted phosphoesterase
MKILVVSDLHYSLKQYDWLTTNLGSIDLVVIAGDLMELASPVDPETQASVVEQYFRRICSHVPLVVCSGNHDLIEEYDGTRSPEWLEEILVPGLTADRGCYATDEVRILSLPWWESEEERDRIGDWLATQHDENDDRPVIWVNHAPPLGSKVSWNGKRDLGDKTLLNWIEKYSPTLVLSGHVHNAPYYAPEGSWIDRVGSTIVVNGGRMIGERPATVEIELQGRDLVWCGMEGCEERSFQEVLTA